MMIAQCASPFYPTSDSDPGRLQCGIPALCDKSGHIGPIVVLNGSLMLEI